MTAAVISSTVRHRVGERPLPLAVLAAAVVMGTSLVREGKQTRSSARGSTPYAGANRIRCEGLRLVRTLSALGAPLSCPTSVRPSFVSRRFAASRPGACASRGSRMDGEGHLERSSDALSGHRYLWRRRRFERLAGQVDIGRAD